MARPITVKRTAIFFVTAALCLAPWVAFNLVTAGTPLPATASAKVEGGLVGLLSGTREPLRMTLFERPWQFELEWVQWLWSVNVLLPSLMLVGLGAIWRRTGRSAVVPALVLVIQPIGMALLAPYRGPAFQEGRYSIHLLPLAIVVAVMALAWLAPWPRLRAAVALLFLIASM